MRVLGKSFKREFSMRCYPSKKLVVEVARTESGIPVLRLWEKRARNGKVEIPLETVYQRLLVGSAR